MSDLSQQKLKKLVELEGFDDDTDLIAAAVADSVCPAICLNDGCDYTTEMEPDQDRGWCEVCRTNSLEERARARRHHLRSASDAEERQRYQDEAHEV